MFCSAHKVAVHCSCRVPGLVVHCALSRYGALYCSWSRLEDLCSYPAPGWHCSVDCFRVARFIVLGLALLFCIPLRSLGWHRIAHRSVWCISFLVSSCRFVVLAWPPVLVHCASPGHGAFYCSWSCFSFRFNVQLPGWKCIVYCICMPRFVVLGLVLLFCVTVRPLGGGVLRTALA
jgi:hypothetical protein